MSPLAAFLEVLLREGRAVLQGPPAPATSQDAEAIGLLRRVYDDYRLHVAGPPIDFAAPTALAAAAVLNHACWFLLSRDEPESELERLLKLPGPPRSAAEHLSADLVLRYLPQVHRRARAHEPADRLTALLEDLLRRWPLSGVLADLEEGPLTPPDFEGHPGLLMLYAERLAQHERPNWVPQGPGLEYLELVFRGLGKDPAPLLLAAQPLAIHQTAEPGEGTDE